MRKLLCSVVALSMMAAAMPVAAGETGVRKGAPSAAPLHDAIQQAAARFELTPPASAASSSVTSPLTTPRRGSNQVRRQGSGHAGMIIGVVSTVIGAAATVYVVKQMQKTTDQVKQQTQQ
jgi:hypothetical protein